MPGMRRHHSGFGSNAPMMENMLDNLFEGVENSLGETQHHASDGNPFQHPAPNALLEGLHEMDEAMAKSLGGNMPAVVDAADPDSEWSTDEKGNRFVKLDMAHNDKMSINVKEG